MGGSSGVFQCVWQRWEGEGGGEGEIGEGAGHTQPALCAWGRDKESRRLSQGVGDVWRKMRTCTEKPWTLSLEEKRSK